MSAFKTSLAVLSLLLPASAFAVGVDKAVSDVCKTSKDAAFRAKYCQAAKDNKKGYVANRSTAAIWGGVSVVCLAACGKTYSGAGVVCKASSLGGSAGESMITKNFVESLTGDAENLQELVAKKDAASATTEAGAADGGGKFDGDACTTAGTTALKSYEKIANSKQNERSLQDLREQTKGMNTDPNVPSYVMGTSAKLGSTGDEAGQVSATAEICSESALGSALGSIRCAASVDPTLPSYVKSENFLKDLQQASGKSPDEFFAGFESPAKALFDSPAMASFSEDGQKGAAESLLAMEKAANRRTIASIDSAEGYVSGGGNGIAKGVGDEDSGFDVNSAIANLFGEKKTENEAPGVGTITVGANRRPASDRVLSPEDRTISLFDRVGWRYGAISSREHLGFGGMSGGKK